jgi:hypothetical protein
MFTSSVIFLAMVHTVAASIAPFVALQVSFLGADPESCRRIAAGA